MSYGSGSLDSRGLFKWQEAAGQQGPDGDCQLMTAAPEIAVCQCYDAGD